MEQNPSDPRKQIKYLIGIFKCFGLAPFSSVPKEQLVLFILQMIHFISITYIFIEALFILNEFEDNNLSTLVSALVFVTLSVAHAIFNFEALLKRKAGEKLFDIYSKIDSGFREKFTVNARIDKWNKKHIFNFIIVLVIVFGSDVIIVISKYVNGYNNGFWYTVLSRFVLRLRMFQFILYVHMASARLHLLNDKLKGIVISRKCSVNICHHENILLYRRDGEEPAINLIPACSVKQILTLKNIFGHLWEAMNLINDCFGWSLLAIVCSCFLDFTSNGYWLFLAMEGILPGFVIVECLCRMISLALTLSILSWICDRCKRQSDKTGRLVGKLEQSQNNEQYNSLVSEFSLQIMHESIRVSANGFFIIDLELFGSMAAATITYLVVLIQFVLNEKDSEDESADNE